MQEDSLIFNGEKVLHDFTPRFDKINSSKSLEILKWLIAAFCLIFMVDSLIDLPDYSNIDFYIFFSIGLVIIFFIDVISNISNKKRNNRIILTDQRLILIKLGNKNKNLETISINKENLGTFNLVEYKKNSYKSHYHSTILYIGYSLMTWALILLFFMMVEFIQTDILNVPNLIGIIIILIMDLVTFAFLKAQKTIIPELNVSTIGNHMFEIKPFNKNNKLDIKDKMGLIKLLANLNNQAGSISKETNVFNDQKFMDLDEIVNSKGIDFNYGYNLSRMLLYEKIKRKFVKTFSLNFVLITSLMIIDVLNFSVVNSNLMFSNYYKILLVIYSIKYVIDIIYLLIFSLRLFNKSAEDYVKKSYFGNSFHMVFSIIMLVFDYIFMIWVSNSAENLLRTYFNMLYYDSPEFVDMLIISSTLFIPLLVSLLVYRLVKNFNQISKKDIDSKLYANNEGLYFKSIIEKEVNPQYAKRIERIEARRQLRQAKFDPQLNNVVNYLSYSNVYKIEIQGNNDLQSNYKKILKSLLNHLFWLFVVIFFLIVLIDPEILDNYIIDKLFGDIYDEIQGSILFHPFPEKYSLTIFNIGLIIMSGYLIKSIVKVYYNYILIMEPDVFIKINNSQFIPVKYSNYQDLKENINKLRLLILNRKKIISKNIAKHRKEKLEFDHKSIKTDVIPVFTNKDNEEIENKEEWIENKLFKFEEPEEKKEKISQKPDVIVQSSKNEIEITEKVHSYFNAILGNVQSKEDESFDKNLIIETNKIQDTEPKKETEESAISSTYSEEELSRIKQKLKIEAVKPKDTENVNIKPEPIISKKPKDIPLKYQANKCSICGKQILNNIKICPYCGFGNKNYIE